jgi:hypothetical protein
MNPVVQARLPVNHRGLCCRAASRHDKLETNLRHGPYQFLGSRAQRTGYFPADPFEV